LILLTNETIQCQISYIDFLSFAISFATTPAALANCPPFSSVISLLCMAVPKEIYTLIFFINEAIKYQISYKFSPF
jgi:hypothetical protein